MSKSVSIVIPTTGTIYDALSSVLIQTYAKVFPYIVADGPNTQFDMMSIKDQSVLSKYITVLSENVGKAGGNFYGHRVYAASPHLVNTDYVMLLDADNWYEKDHVASLVDLMDRHNLDFGFSLRRIYEGDKWVCDDNCESLGFWPAWIDLNTYLVDTSSYIFKREWFIKYSWIWHHGWGADRRFFNTVRAIPGVRYGCTGKHTLCYRLGGNQGSVTKEFFQQGNHHKGKQHSIVKIGPMQEIIQQEFPWHQERTKIGECGDNVT